MKRPRPVYEAQADGTVVEYWCQYDHQDCFSNAEMSRLCFESTPLPQPTFRQRARRRLTGDAP